MAEGTETGMSNLWFAVRHPFIYWQWRKQVASLDKWGFQ
jgi:hypothetical protein